jgi:hypothetical protein
MGLSSAGDVFTTRFCDAVDYTIEGWRCTEDTLLDGHTSDKLTRKTREFIAACSKAGITLNVKKIVYDKPEVVFGGYLINKNGYTIDPALSTALSEFPVPKSQTDIRSFCGLANQMCNFSDDISEAFAPFKHLLKKGQKFEWNDDLQAVFEAARRHLTSIKTLAFYRPDRKMRLVTDACRLNGIGFVLKQEIDGIWRPVKAGSRFLTETEGRYAIVELELLAICWAAKKCVSFIDGLPLTNFEIGPITLHSFQSLTSTLSQKLKTNVFKGSEPSWTTCSSPQCGSRGKTTPKLMSCQGSHIAKPGRKTSSTTKTTACQHQ